MEGGGWRVEGGARVEGVGFSTGLGALREGEATRARDWKGRRRGAHL